jgi:hypothetical protein
MDHLPGFLPDGAEGEERSLWAHSGLFLELAAGRGEWILTHLGNSFGDRPGSDVAALPEGAAGMSQEYLEGTGLLAIEQ